MQFRCMLRTKSVCHAYRSMNPSPVLLSCGIGVWGTDWYTDEQWDESWPQECEQMKSTTAGITREGFGILYGKYRRTEEEDLRSSSSLAEDDLKRCRGETPDADGC